MGEVAVRIGELSKRTGVSRRSLRYYEQRGLLHARRTDAGWREYDEGIITRVRNIAGLLEVGMTIEDIQQVAECLDVEDRRAYADPDEAIAIHEARLSVLDARMSTLRDHRARLEQRLAQLRAAKTHGDGRLNDQQLEGQ